MTSESRAEPLLVFYRPLSLYARRVTTLLTPLLLTTGPRARREREPEGPGREEEKR